MYYYWMSFSKAVPAGSGIPGNLGAVVLTSQVPLDAEGRENAARYRDLVPEESISIMSAELDEDEAHYYPHDVLMSRETLEGYSDRLSNHRIGMCADCAAEHPHLHGEDF